MVIDDGHTATKVVWRRGDEGGAFVFPSKAVLGDVDISGGELPNADVYFVDAKVKAKPNQIYTVYGREYPITVDNRFEGFPLSKQNRVLVHHALVEAECMGDVEVITTIPVRDYFVPNADSRKNDELMVGKNTNVASPCYRRNPLDGEGEEPHYNISNAIVLPEGVYAIYDVALSASPVAAELLSFQKKYFSDNTGFAVIDIGGKTTDVIIADWNQEDANFTIDILKSKTMKIGVMDVAIALEREIEKKFNVSNLSFDALSLLDQKSITLSGVQHDVTDIVDDVVEMVGDKISNRIAPLLDGYRQFGLMVFCGGGAALFKSVANQYPATVVHMPDDPQYSNAMGIMKFQAVQQHSIDQGGAGDE